MMPKLPNSGESGFDNEQFILDSASVVLMLIGDLGAFFVTSPPSILEMCLTSATIMSLFI